MHQALNDLEFSANERGVYAVIGIVLPGSGSLART